MKVRWSILVFSILMLFGCNEKDENKTIVNTESNNMSMKKSLGDSVVNFKYAEIEKSTNVDLKNVLDEFEIISINRKKIILFDTEIKSYFEFNYGTENNTRSNLWLRIKDNVNDSLGFVYKFLLGQQNYYVKEGYFYASIFILDDYLIPKSAMVLKRNSAGEKYFIVNYLDFDYFKCNIKRYDFNPIPLDITDINYFNQVQNLNRLFDNNIKVILSSADTINYNKNGCSDKWLLYLDYKEDYLLNN